MRPLLHFIRDYCLLIDLAGVLVEFGQAFKSAPATGTLPLNADGTSRPLDPWGQYQFVYG